MSSKRFTYVVILALFPVTAFIGCGSQSTGPDPSANSTVVAQVFTITPPCIPVPDSEVDPCERRDSWSSTDGMSISYQDRPALPYDVYQHIKTTDRYKNATSTPQFIVRATTLSNSFRCDRENLFMSYTNEGERKTWFWDFELDHKSYFYMCYVDLDVHEYFDGTGPDSLTVVIWSRFGPPRYYDQGMDYLNSVYKKYLSKWLDREFIFPLVRYNNVSHAVWSIAESQVWDVQRNEDGTVEVISWWATVSYPPEKYGFILTLDEYRENARSGIARYYRETGGRVGVTGVVPVRANDAGMAGLMEMYRSLGAFSVADVTPSVPPPAPGQGNPNPNGLDVLDETATVSPEVPGGLEETETPGPLGDDAANATATAESTVTPEPAPTPEQVDTPTPESEVAPTATPEPAPTPEPDPTVATTPEAVVESTATATPEPVIEPTATPETVPTDTATPEPEPVVDPTATPEDAVVPTETPEPEVPGPEGPGSTEGPGGEGPDEPGSGTPGDNGPGAGPDG